MICSFRNIIVLQSLMYDFLDDICFLNILDPVIIFHLWLTLKHLVVLWFCEMY